MLQARKLSERTDMDRLSNQLFAMNGESFHLEVCIVVALRANNILLTSVTERCTAVNQRGTCAVRQTQPSLRR